MARYHRKKKSSSQIIIYKSNELVESGYKFNLWEMRAFLAVLSMINSYDDTDKIYRLTCREFKDYFLLKSGDTYEFLREAMRALFQKYISIPDRDETGIAVERLVHLISEATTTVQNKTQAEYNENKEYIEFKIESKAKPYLLQFKKNFGKTLGTYTRYELRNVTKLRSPYAIRLYELLKQYQNTNTKSRVISILELKKMFQIETEYPRFSNFYQMVIKSSIEMINLNTDIAIINHDAPDHRIKERGRVMALRFTFRVKTEQEQMALWPKDYAGYQPTLFPGDPQPEETDMLGAGVLEERLDGVQELFLQVAELWRVEEMEFYKRVAGKPLQDIRFAIEYTRAKEREGRVVNPAGMFLDAVTKGYKTPDQVKQENVKVRNQKEKEKKALVAPMIEEYTRIDKEYEKAINSMIKIITEAQPEVTERAIARIKSNYKSESIREKTIEDFRKIPMLRGFVKAEIMKEFPNQFKPVHELYEEKMEQAKQKILAIDPTAKFDD